MVGCKYDSCRKLPIEYRIKENFLHQPGYAMTLCLITGGYAVALVNGERCYMGANTLLCIQSSDTLQLLAQSQLKAKSICFAPQFLNVKLDEGCIQSPDYELYRRDKGYPRLNMFLERNLYYNGVLPLLPQASAFVNDSMERIVRQISEQPDARWSCRARAILFRLLDMIEFECDQLCNANIPQNKFVCEVMEYIHLHIGDVLSVQMLCKIFHTNHTTLNRYFQRAAGMSTSGYIFAHRLKVAKHTLAFTALSVEEISKLCGFQEQTYFAKVFKKHCGVTPLKYRRDMQAKRFKGQ